MSKQVLSRGGGLVLFLAACRPAMLAAEPTASDVARDVAALAARVNDLELLKTVVLGLLGASALALPALWWRLGKKIHRVAEARISALLESRPGALLTMVDEHDREVKLRRQSRIVIVSETLDLEAVLRQHGFLKVVSTPGGEADALRDAAAVVFDLRTLAEGRRRASYACTAWNSSPLLDSQVVYAVTYQESRISSSNGRCRSCSGLN